MVCVWKSCSVCQDCWPVGQWNQVWKEKLHWGCRFVNGHGTNGQLTSPVIEKNEPRQGEKPTCVSHAWEKVGSGRTLCPRPWKRGKASILLRIK